MNMRLETIVCLTGIVIGIMSARVLASIQWFNVVLWAFTGIVIGLFSPGRKRAIRSGSLYGLFLTISFLVSGFQGTPDKLPHFLILVLVLSLAGIAGGILCTVIGELLKRSLRYR